MGQANGRPFFSLSLFFIACAETTVQWQPRRTAIRTSESCKRCGYFLIILFPAQFTSINTQTDPGGGGYRCGLRVNLTPDCTLKDPASSSREEPANQPALLEWFRDERSEEKENWDTECQKLGLS
uniref:Putative secreted protein n=1 Tax=Anopheles darlingi TaxID=43151 RepID=A0A2M4D683_ANODA